MWQHINLCEQICPWDTLACCWDKQPANNSYLYPVLFACLCHSHCSILYRSLCLWCPAITVSLSPQPCHHCISVTPTLPSLYLCHTNPAIIVSLSHQPCHHCISITPNSAITVSLSPPALPLLYLCHPPTLPSLYLCHPNPAITVSLSSQSCNICMSVTPTLPSLYLCHLYSVIFVSLSHVCPAVSEIFVTRILPSPFLAPICFPEILFKSRTSWQWC